MITYRHFIGEEARLIYTEIEDQLIECYMTVFNADGAVEWEENWTEKTSKLRFNAILFSSKDGRVPMISIMYNDDAKVVGFLTGAVVMESAFMNSHDYPYDFFGVDHKEIDQFREEFYRKVSYPVFTSADLGIYKEYRRGLNPLINMYKPQFDYAQSAGCKKVVGFSSFPKKAFFLFRAVGVRVEKEFSKGDALVYMAGSVTLIKSILTFSPIIVKIYIWLSLFRKNLIRKQPRLN